MIYLSDDFKDLVIINLKPIVNAEYALEADYKDVERVRQEWQKKGIE